MQLTLGDFERRNDDGSLAFVDKGKTWNGLSREQADGMTAILRDALHEAFIKMQAAKDATKGKAR